MNSCRTLTEFKKRIKDEELKAGEKNLHGRRFVNWLIQGGCKRRHKTGLYGGYTKRARLYGGVKTGEITIPRRIWKADFVQETFISQLSRNYPPKIVFGTSYPNENYLGIIDYHGTGECFWIAMLGSMSQQFVNFDLEESDGVELMSSENVKIMKRNFENDIHTTDPTICLNILQQYHKNFINNRQDLNTAFAYFIANQIRTLRCKDLYNFTREENKGHTNFKTNLDEFKLYCHENGEAKAEGDIQATQGDFIYAAKCIWKMFYTLFEVLEIDCVCILVTTMVGRNKTVQESFWPNPKNRSSIFTEETSHPFIIPIAMTSSAAHGASLTVIEHLQSTGQMGSGHYEAWVLNEDGVKYNNSLGLYNLQNPVRPEPEYTNNKNIIDSIRNRTNEGYAFLQKRIRIDNGEETPNFQSQGWKIFFGSIGAPTSMDNFVLEDFTNVDELLSNEHVDTKSSNNNGVVQKSKETTTPYSDADESPSGDNSEHKSITGNDDDSHDNSSTPIPIDLPNPESNVDSEYFAITVSCTDNGYDTSFMIPKEGLAPTLFEVLTQQELGTWDQTKKSLRNLFSRLTKTKQEDVGPHVYLSNKIKAKILEIYNNKLTGQYILTFVFQPDIGGDPNPLINTLPNPMKVTLKKLDEDTATKMKEARLTLQKAFNETIKTITKKQKIKTQQEQADAKEEAALDTAWNFLWEEDPSLTARLTDDVVRSIVYTHHQKGLSLKENIKEDKAFFDRVLKLMPRNKIIITFSGYSSEPEDNSSDNDDGLYDSSESDDNSSDNDDGSSSPSDSNDDSSKIIEKNPHDIGTRAWFQQKATHEVAGTEDLNLANFFE